MLNEGREAEEYPSFLAVRKTPVKLLTQVAPFADTAADAVEVADGNGDSEAAIEPTPSASTQAAIGLSAEALERSAKATTDAIRTLVLTDRALHEKAQRAFVSAVQAYSKHVASSIFRSGELDWDSMAEGWGLLRMPKMPELKGWRGTYIAGDAANGATGGNDEPVGQKKAVDGETHPEEDQSRGWDWKKKQSLGLSIDLRNLAYKDRDREKKRQLELTQMAEPMSKEALDEIHAAKRAKKSAWSDKNKAHDVAAQRRDRKAAKRDQERKGKMTVEERRKDEETRAMIEEVRKWGMIGAADFGNVEISLRHHLLFAADFSSRK
jgi:ATP-dependent RNA helicase DDX55/SPB4